MKCLTDGKEVALYESEAQATELKKIGFIECDLDLTKADVQQDIIDAMKASEKKPKKGDDEYITKVSKPKKKPVKGDK